MKNGLINENGELIYYENDIPVHKGVVEIDGDIYYITSKGRAVKGEHIVHGEMTHGIIKKGTYTFGEDGKLIKNSYKAPKKEKKKKNKSKKIVNLKNKDIKKWLPLIYGGVIIIVAVIAFLMGVEFNENRNETSKNDNTEIVLPQFENEVLLCSEGAKKLYDGEIDIVQALKSGAPYKPFAFEYDLKGKSGTLTISENGDFSNGKDYILAEGTKSVYIDNLKTGTQYYYKVTVDGQGYFGNFKTANSTRFVKLDGIINTRDIGGYKTLDGKTVKQGLLIRGTEIDGLVEAGYFLKNDAISPTLETFGFVYDFDLRSSSVFKGEYNTRFGNQVGHKFYNSPQYGGIFSEQNLELVRDIFSDLAKEQNYPMYFHCSYGADRTGTIVFLLQCVLNTSEQDMINEYKRTAFADSTFLDSTRIYSVVNGLENYEGETLQQKAVDYLVNTVGVTEEEIESIRKIFLE